VLYFICVVHNALVIMFIFLHFVVAISAGQPVIIQPAVKSDNEGSIPAVFDKLPADQLSTNGKFFCSFY